MYWFDRYAVREKKLKFSSDGLKKKNNNFDSMRAPGFTLFAKHRLTISIRISIKQSYNSLTHPPQPATFSLPSAL